MGEKHEDMRNILRALVGFDFRIQSHISEK
jgi:hypothetical protein